jgi:hypothetical protein
MEIKSYTNDHMNICCFCENVTKKTYTAFMRNDVNIILNKFFNQCTLTCCYSCFKNNIYQNDNYIQNYLYNRYKMIYIGEFYTKNEIVLHNTKKSKKYKLFHKYSIFYIKNNKRPYKIYTLVKNDKSNVYEEIIHELNKKNIEPLEILK